MPLVSRADFSIPDDATHAVYVTGANAQGIRQPAAIARAFVEHEFPVSDIGNVKHVVLVWGGDNFGPPDRPTVGDLTFEVYKLLTERGLRVTAVAAQVDLYANDKSPLLDDKHPMRPIVVPLPTTYSHDGKTAYAGTDWHEDPVGTTEFFFDEVGNAVEEQEINNVKILLAPGGLITTQQAIFFRNSMWISKYPYEQGHDSGLVVPLSDLQLVHTMYELMIHLGPTHRWTNDEIEGVRRHGGGMFIHRQIRRS